MQHEKQEHQKSITLATEKKILHSKSHHKPTVETELLRKQEEERLKKLATAGSMFFHLDCEEFEINF